MQNQEQKRGMFICFEGLDHCGKSTQVKKLQNYLLEQKKEVEIIQFPGFTHTHQLTIIERTTEIGILINQYLTNSKNLDNTVIHMLFSINRWEYQKHIEAKLNAGVTIILDRYAYSGVAFTAAKGYDLEWCKNADRGLPEPDLIIYLQISEEEIVKRGDFGKEVYEKQDFQKQVKLMFEKLIDENKSNFVAIDGNQSIEVIEKQISNLVDKLYQEINGEKTKSISKLWIN